MMNILRAVAGFLVLGCVAAGGQAVGTAQDDAARWKAEAARVRIVRDDWGIAHVHGKTDADAVFGMMYAQCEDDFNRVERNYLTSLGRTAEADGAGAVWQDLRQRLFIDPVTLQKLYAESPVWLQALMNAWADGANFYLMTHPAVKAKVLTRFEPWMALSFTEGSIGGDIERVNLRKLEEFYGNGVVAEARVEMPQMQEWEKEPGGSNGIAVGPKNTTGHHALLLINPHTSFFFRSELQMASDEGLNAYGAVTWGQFFVYQGFNEKAGWMHTSSGVDAVDEFVETVQPGPDGMAYKYGPAMKSVISKKINIRYKTPTGMVTRAFTAYFTEHGPVIRKDGAKWVSIKLMNIPVPALQQSFLRTKARNYAEYAKTMELQANSSNNTIYADADGTIAYWHGNFIPRRDVRFDYKRPVDGSVAATDWQGLLTTAEAPHLKDPASGWLFNVNDSPWTGAGASSLKRGDFPAYVETGVESARGMHATKVLAGRKDFTVDGLIAAAYDSYLPWFETVVSAVVKAWSALPENDPRKAKLAGQVAVLKAWDLRWAGDSVATSLAVFWGTELRREAGPRAGNAWLDEDEAIGANVPAGLLLGALEKASDRLTADFGSWRTPWGEINRFQRLTGEMAQRYADAKESLPVGFTSAVWGSLASFGAQPRAGTKRWYGDSGNSFVAVVEFGDKVRAKAVTAGGESGHPESKHFDDEAGRYAAGNLRDVYFYPEQLKGHTEATYSPGVR